MCKKLIVFILLFKSLGIVGQKNTISNRLNEVIVNASKRLKKSSIGQSIVHLSDSLIIRNTESFTDLIRFNTSIYLREYGKGGTSSVCFRGTSASNTAVVWNGINVNSFNNGQTGFNALNVNLFDGIDIRSGGGSIEFGSGAIGGTIHLSDKIEYFENDNIENRLVLNVGSFNTYNSLFKSKISNNNYNVNIGLVRNSSTNDFKLFNTKFNNSNGSYENYAMNLSLGYRINKISEIKIYSSSFIGKRGFSGTLPNPVAANEQYQDSYSRNLIKYGIQGEKTRHELSTGYLTQKYNYYPNKLSNQGSFGQSRRYVFLYLYERQLPKLKISLTSFSEYESAFGETDRIQIRNRRQFSQYFIFKQNILSNLSYNLKVRKDFNTDYDVPLIYSGGLKFRFLENFYVRINGSKNYRVPTYNDLFWPGQGNLNLVPETAEQEEVGVGYESEKMTFDVGIYSIKTNNKIIWTPSGDSERPGVWVPINVAETSNRGLESTLELKRDFKGIRLNAILNYSYTLAKDLRLDKFLIFVPKHLFNGNLSITKNRWSLSLQTLYNDEVYSTQDNDSDSKVSSFFLLNSIIEYRLKKFFNSNLTLGVRINNVLGEQYMVLPRRPMPLRNFNFNINYKF
ncbi:MAG TPA: TonB-dependent receptor [Tenacibaculum sp.]|nr:TonB-dependent receptor [Tenacibaculum sp.]